MKKGDRVVTCSITIEKTLRRSASQGAVTWRELKGNLPTTPQRYDSIICHYAEVVELRRELCNAMTESVWLAHSEQLHVKGQPENSARRSIEKP